MFLQKLAMGFCFLSFLLKRDASGKWFFLCDSAGMFGGEEMGIVGRHREREKLENLLATEKSEFIAVHGRRRVGKTFLVREYFRKQFTFFTTGFANSTKETLLEIFRLSLKEYGAKKVDSLDDWITAFEKLKGLVLKKKGKQKKVIFIDELPWFATKGSGFISALEHFWNSFASDRKDVVLIVCGSSSSFIVNNIINNRGGLHNRITGQIKLSPFSLGECEEYFASKKIPLTRYQVIESYMVFGGVPYYLSLMKNNKSLYQNIDKMCFEKNALLENEFENLYRSLFANSENYIKAVKVIAKKNQGLSREEIVRGLKIKDGGTVSKILNELEASDFIRKYNAFGKSNKGAVFQLVDPFSLFYLKFLQSSKNNDENFWMHFGGSPKHNAWKGYAFEIVCLWHVDQIKNRLGISGISTNTFSLKTDKAQIDLIIDRADNMVNLCEIKFAISDYVITKKYNEVLRNKQAEFFKKSKAKKGILQTMITPYGIKKNEYASEINSEIVMDDLFD